jgi:uncharacterized protein (DUF433 family)
MIVYTDPAPVRLDDSGTLRVGTSRVTLDALLQYWRMGMTPEEIARGLDTLTLADVHGTLAYYLRHQAEIDDYLQRREHEAESLRQQFQSANSERLASLKKRVDAIRAQENGGHASPAD